MLARMPNPRDPTGTYHIRASFRKAGCLRVRQLRSGLRRHLIDNDALGLAGGIMDYHAESVRLTAFAAWLEAQAGHQLVGVWPRPYIARAWHKGLGDAIDEVGALDQSASMDGVERLAQLARQELDGLTAALVQQVSRDAASVLQRKLKPHLAWRILAKTFDKIVNSRSDAICNVLTVKAYNQAKLEVYKTSGATRVGVTPEYLPALPSRAATYQTRSGRDAAHLDSTSRNLPKQQASIIADARNAPDEAEPEEREATFEEPGTLVGISTANDDRVCPACEDFADASPHEIDDVLDQLPMHPNAVLQGSTFASYGNTHEMVRAKFSGMAVTIRTGDNWITIGPNHPMLTRRGWLPAREITEGDQLVYDSWFGSGSQGGRPPNFEQVPLVEDVFQTFAIADGGAQRLTAARDDLHGDAIFCEPEVDVVYPAGDLLLIANSGGIEQFSKLNLARADTELKVKTRLRSSFAFLGRVLAAAYGLMRSGDLAFALSSGSARPFYSFLFGRTALSRSAFFEPQVDGTATDLKPLGQSVDTLARFVEASERFQWHDVIAVVQSHFEGFAFDATTVSGIYNSSGYVVHNCRCAYFIWQDRDDDQYDAEAQIVHGASEGAAVDDERLAEPATDEECE